MINEADLEFPVDIHLQDCPVTLVYQLVGGDAPFMEKVGEERFGTVEVPLQRPGQEIIDLVGPRC